MGRRKKPPEGNTTFEVIKGGRPADIEVDVKQAHDFIEHVEAKVPLQEAAQRVGSTLDKLGRMEIVRHWFESVAPYYVKDPDIRRSAVIGAMFKEMFEAEESGDRIAAARVIIKDPDLGFMNQTPGVSITISDETRKLDVGQLWPDEKEESNS